MKRNRLNKGTKADKMRVLDKEMAPRVLGTPRSPAHRKDRYATCGHQYCTGFSPRSSGHSPRNAPRLSRGLDLHLLRGRVRRGERSLLPVPPVQCRQDPIAPVVMTTQRGRAPPPPARFSNRVEKHRVEEAGCV